MSPSIFDSDRLLLRIYSDPDTSIKTGRIMTKKLTVTLLFACVLTLSTNLSAQDSYERAKAVVECNKVSAHPNDHLSTVPGVAWADLDVEVAREACVKVFTLGAVTGQVIYQSGRLLDKDGNAGAVAYLKQAIEEYQYPIAYYHLGLLYEDGLYVKQSATEAEKLFREGFKRGSLISGIALSRVLEEQADVNVYAVGSYVNNLKALSAQGHAPSKKKLVELRANGYIANYNELFPQDKIE